MDLFEQDDYKAFVRNRLRAMPFEGRGQYRRMAEFLRVHPTLISQIFRRERELTPEQASDLAVFLGLDPEQSEYFLTLVELSRAGSLRLKGLLQRRRDRLREELRAGAKGGSSP
jgi:plasmid maintenance system antidote protein VapI